MRLLQLAKIDALGCDPVEQVDGDRDGLFAAKDPVANLLGLALLERR
jgi:hypothetical protein